jgi:hypothetical protein
MNHVPEFFWKQVCTGRARAGKAPTTQKSSKAQMGKLQTSSSEVQGALKTEDFREESA